MWGKSGNRLQQTVLGKRFGQILVGADHASTCAIKQAILGRQHDQRRVAKTLVFLDQRAGLVTVEPRHHDVAENDFGLMVGDLGERVKTILGQHHLTSGLHEKNLGAAPDGVAIVNNHYLDATQIDGFCQFLPPDCLTVRRLERGLILSEYFCADTIQQ